MDDDEEQIPSNHDTWAALRAATDGIDPDDVPELAAVRALDGDEAPRIADPGPAGRLMGHLDSGRWAAAVGA